MKNHYLNSIEIKNFKGLKDVEIKGFNNINIITGKNGLGKTTLLEAIFLNLGFLKSELFVNIINNKGLFLDNDLLKCQFNSKNYTNPIIIKTIHNNKEYENTITPISISIQSTKQIKDNQIGEKNNKNQIIGKEGDQIRGFKYDCKIKENNTISNFKSECYLDNNFIDSKNSEIPRNHLIPGKFIPIPRPNDPISVNKVVLAGHKEKFLDLLKIIDLNIKDIHIGTNNTIYLDSNNGFLPSIQHGDGTKELVSLISGLMESENGILMIDEFGLLLHYSIIEKVFDELVKISDEKNIQLFLTTHSSDVLKSINNISKNRNIGDKISIFNVNRDNKIFRFESKDLDIPNSDLDVR